MQTRTGWLLLGTIALLCAVGGVRSCSSARSGDDARGVAPTPTQAPPSAALDGVAQAQAEALSEQTPQRDAALYAAVATLQKYLAALGRGGDFVEADAFWSNGAPSAGSREADLRTLRELRGMRIENGAPKALDANAVPEALEIPVELRISVASSPLRRYRGWYRLRRSGADAWHITSASVEPVPRGG